MLVIRRAGSNSEPSDLVYKSARVRVLGITHYGYMRDICRNLISAEHQISESTPNRGRQDALKKEDLPPPRLEGRKRSRFNCYGHLVFFGT
jgi:hypothetical protein